MTRKNAVKEVTRQDIRRVLFEARVRGSLKEALDSVGIDRQAYYHAKRKLVTVPKIGVAFIEPLVAIIKVSL